MGADPVMRSRPEGSGSSPRAGTMDRVEWLLREEKSERTLHIGERAEIDDACCKAAIERLEIRSELRVFLTDAEARCDVSVEPRDNREEEWLASQVTVAGRAGIDFLDGQRAHATVDQAIPFRVPGRRAVYAIKAGMRRPRGNTSSAVRASRLSAERRFGRREIPGCLVCEALAGGTCAGLPGRTG